jgi:hypothetical protein
MVAMGNGILAVLAISSGFLIFCLTRGQKMREEKRFWPELFWYTGGLIVLTTITVVWTAMENQAVPQRILLAALGAALGGIGLYALGEYLRPSAVAQAPSSRVESTPPANSVDGSINNNKGVVTQGQVGNNTVINNPTAPAYSGTLAPKSATLFSPQDGESSTIPRIQFGTSNVVYGVKELGRDSPLGTLLFPALNERQFKIESIDGKLKVSTEVADGNGKLIAELIHNEWKVAPPPGTWDRNYTDDALEVRDASGNVVLQIRALPDRIQLQGIWWVDTGFNGVVQFVIRGNPKDGGQIVLVPKNNKDGPPRIEQMFRYPSDRHLGELAGRS